MSAPAPAPAAPAAEFPVPQRSRTPRLLQRLQLAVALVLLVGGALTAWMITDLRADLATAPVLAEQYARLGQVRHNLNSAADLAARSVLAGEKADGEKARAASAALGTAAGTLVDAAQARPEDAAALKALSTDMLGYAQLLGSAAGAPRAQALPLLTQADARLATLLDGVAGVQSGLAEQAAARPLSQNNALVLWPAILLLGVVVWVSWQVARRSHRVLNLGLAGAALAVVLVASVGLNAQNTAASASQVSRATQFTHVATLATAVDELDHAQRVLTTATLEQAWSDTASGEYQDAFTAASRAAATEKLPSLKGFDTAAKDLVGLLEKRDWAGAAKVLTAGQGLDAVASDVRAKAADKTGTALATATAEPEAARTTLLIELVLVVVLALAGAALGALGLARRLQEYR